MQEEILVIGDVMIDKYSYGEIRRLNPEGPNSLLNIIKEEYKLGGAANVAANIASLNGTCDLIGLVGNDENADILNNVCKENNINFFSLKKEKFSTIIKQRFVENTYHQQLLRVDYEEKLQNQDDILEDLKKLLKERNYKIIVISDYNKGIIFEELVKYVKDFASKNTIKVLVDAKPYNYQFFNGVCLIKPNFKEFCEMIGKEIDNNNKEIEKYGLDFIKKMNTNLVITRGKLGASLITRVGEYLHLETEAKKVFDVSGAGDTFIATITYALNNGYSLKDSVKLANKASSIIVGKIGTAIIDKKELFDKKY